MGVTKVQVRSQEIDCAVGSMRQVDPLLSSVRLHREEYALVAAPALLARQALRVPSQAGAHALVDISRDLPLFGYWRDAPGAGDLLRFGRVLQMGTIAAIRAVVLRGDGVAVLPVYLIKPDLEARRLVRVLRGVKPLVDHFRLFFRTGDPRRSVYGALAARMLAEPLR